MGHSNTLVSARNSEGNRWLVDVDVKSDSEYSLSPSSRGDRHASWVLQRNLDRRQFENRPKIDRLLTPSIHEAPRPTHNIQIRDRATVTVRQS